MLFNSIQFAIFLPIVFLLYWFVFGCFISKSEHQLRLQNAFVVVASYVFYGWWDWRFFVAHCLYLILFVGQWIAYRKGRVKAKGEDMDVA